MHWVIDYKDRFIEEEYNRLIELLDRADIPFTLVSLENNQLVDDVSITEPVIVIGTIPLMKVAQDKGWLCFLNDNFRFEKWVDHYGEHLLNYDSLLFQFCEVPYNSLGEEFFIRPVKDGKLFTGRLIKSNEFSEWREKRLARPNDFGFGSLDKFTKVVVSKKKEILREYRFFVIDGRVVTGSLYRQGLYIVRELCVDQNVIDYAQRMVDIWQPDRGFVIDIAQMVDGYKIIEINCLNTSGFYMSDIYKIIDAIENMKF